MYRLLEPDRREKDSTSYQFIRRRQEGNKIEVPVTLSYKVKSLLHNALIPTPVNTVQGPQPPRPSNPLW